MTIMQMQIIMAVVTVVTIAGLPSLGQGDFQDLDFESATLSPVTPNGPVVFVPISSALPGWSASIGGVSVTEVVQNNCTLGQASIDIFGPNYPVVGQESPFGQGTIDGNYTVFVQSGANPQDEEMGVNASIWQTGTIPADAQSLEFKAWTYLSSGAFSVSFDGDSLSPVVLSSTMNLYGIPLIEYGANIAPYAGQTGELEFTSIFNYHAPSWTELDDIGFSTVAVTPEPNTLALVVMGGLALAARSWRKKGL
jgi:hypothetical protein